VPEDGEADTPLDELVKLVTQAEYTKFPVYEDDLDQVIGILHVKDVLRLRETARDAPHQANYGMRLRELNRPRPEQRGEHNGQVPIA
jgi:Mg2+/Co2+ transporter CorB